jgi:circadian clock protein KaiC
MIKKKAKKTQSKKLNKKKPQKKHIQKKQAKKKHSAKKLNTNKKVQTWIPNFDKLVGGGLIKDSINLLVGGSGSGKSIFATQFLIEAMERGEKGLYVTFEEKKEQFYENMLSIGWDLEAYEKKGLFTFLEYTPIKVKTMLEEGGGSIESAILNKKITRIVIDSITSFALLFNDELSQREAALSLFSMIRDWNCTSLLTLEEEPTDKNRVTSRAMEFEVDSIVALYGIRNGKERKHYIEILKIRGSGHSHKIYPFEIGKKGISIKNTPLSRIL